MNPKQISPLTVAVNQRFFLAVDYLISSGIIRGLETYCKEVGLSRPKYSELRSQYGNVPNPKKSRYTYVDYEAVCSLAMFYGFSSDWLLLGKGKMLLS